METLALIFIYGGAFGAVLFPIVASCWPFPVPPDPPRRECEQWR